MSPGSVGMCIEQSGLVFITNKLDVCLEKDSQSGLINFKSPPYWIFVVAK